MDQRIERKGSKMTGFAIFSKAICIEVVKEILCRKRESLIQTHQGKMTAAEKGLVRGYANSGWLWSVQINILRM
jgi:hypothetical protein